MEDMKTLANSGTNEDEKHENLADGSTNKDEEHNKDSFSMHDTTKMRGTRGLAGGGQGGGWRRGGGRGGGRALKPEFFGSWSSTPWRLRF